MSLLCGLPSSVIHLAQEAPCGFPALLLQSQSATSSLSTTYILGTGHTCSLSAPQMPQTLPISILPTH